MGTPRVSILVPNYNYGRFLTQAIETLLAQTLKDLEVIVIDDASTDESSQVLDQYTAHPRVRIIRHAVNRGHIRSYNEGLALARGAYVGIVSADDYCLWADALERQVAVFERFPEVGMVYSAHCMLDPDGRITRVAPRAEDGVRNGLDEFRSLLWGNYILHSGTLLKRDVQEKLGPYDPTLPQSGDWDLWLRASALSAVGYIAEPLYVYRLHRSNMQSRGIPPAQQADQNVRTLDKAFASLPPETPPDIIDARERARQHALLQTAWFDLRNGRCSRAWAGVRHALRREPAIAANPEVHRFLARLVLRTCLSQPRYERVLDRLRALTSPS